MKIQHSEPEDVGPQAGLLSYPGINDNPDAITVELEHVRAADSLVISYDFARDGFVIARLSFPDKEVAFIEAWDADTEFPIVADEL